MARNRLHPLESHLPTAKAAIAGIEVFITVGQHVGFGHDSTITQGRWLRRRSDVHALANAIGDALDFPAAVASVRGDKVDIREQHIPCKITSLQQQPRCHPTTTSGPSRNRRRAEQRLAQGAGGAVEIRHTRHGIQTEFPIGGDGQLHRRFNLAADGCGTVEILRHEEGFKQHGHLVVCISQNTTQLGRKFRAEFLAHEVAVDLAGDILGSHRLRHDEVDNFHTVEVSAVAKKRFRITVMQICVDHEIEIDVVPASKGASGLADIGLAVIAHAHGEQFHDFPGKILVRRALDVDASIEERQHRRILGNRHHQVAEATGPHFMK